MTGEPADFWKWLWSDWGKPNVLTRAGIPRVLTNLLTYVLILYVSFSLTLRFSSAADREKLRIAYHDVFFISAYALLYVNFLISWFLEDRYKFNRLRADHRFRVARQNWKDPFFKIFWLSLVATFCLFLLGARHVV